LTRVLPEVVTFWRGPLDRLRQTCLRSQLAAGHKVTVYSFDPLPGLPDGVGNAEAEAVLPYAFSERLRPPQPDGSWRDWTTLQFSDFFRMRLMAQRAGLWLDADVLLLRPVEIDPALPYFAWERPRQLGNSVLYLPPDDPIVAEFTALMAQDALTALARRHGSLRHALPKRSFYAVHAEPKAFFDPSDFSGLIGAPDIIGLHISPKGRGGEVPISGSLYAWAAERFASR
jgi:hypothetical protein